MIESPLIVKSKAFALEVIQVCKDLRVVLGGFIAPIIIVANLNFVPEKIKIITGVL